MSPATHLAFRYTLPGAAFVAIATWSGGAAHPPVLRGFLTVAAAVVVGAALYAVLRFFASYLPTGGSDEVPNASLIREGPAAFESGGAHRLGRLALNGATLTFFDGGLLSATHGRTWNVGELVDVEADDALHLTLRSGERFTLEVPDVEEWKRVLEAAIRP